MSELFAFVFPGQGSQAVGMGADVYRASPAARAVFEAADAALGFPLSTLCFEGPEEQLRATLNTQPVIVATSLALLAALQEAASLDSSSTGTEPRLGTPLAPAYVAGHSVGEYAALTAAGALDLADALRLVRERGRLMHEAGVACPSGMAAVLGMDRATLDAVCEEATRLARVELEQPPAGPDNPPGVATVVVANDNAPGQLVLSGGRRALDIAMDLAKARGAKRVVPLPVSGAFHSPVMAPAAAALASVVAGAPIHDARIPIISNIGAVPLTDAADLKSELARQIESPVQWTRTVEYLAGQGVTTFVEIGPGQVLSGLIKRIVRGAAPVALSMSTAQDIGVVAQQLRAGSE
ncbi:MAG TPA: ACP S-malonyltransferase [Ktedonobacterales bacterium]